MWGFSEWEELTPLQRQSFERDCMLMEKMTMVVQMRELFYHDVIGLDIWVRPNMTMANFRRKIREEEWKEKKGKKSLKKFFMVCAKAARCMPSAWWQRLPTGSRCGCPTD